MDSLYYSESNRILSMSITKKQKILFRLADTIWVENEIFIFGGMAKW